MPNSLIIANTYIGQDAQGRFCLNDLHHAAGGDNKKRPSLWIDNQQTLALIDELQSEAGFPALDIQHGGKTPGTFACRELVYAYAMWISAAFHLKVIRAYDAMVSPAAPAIPTSLSAALRLAADQAEQIEQQQAMLAIAAPKAAFVDQYVESTGLKGFRQVAKLLKASEARLREFLNDKKIMYRLGTDWMAYQSHIDAGRFSVKTGTNTANKHSFSRSLFTPKGVEWLAGLWAVHCLNGGAA